MHNNSHLFTYKGYFGSGVYLHIISMRIKIVSTFFLPLRTLSRARQNAINSAGTRRHLQEGLARLENLDKLGMICPFPPEELHSKNKTRTA